MTVAKVGMAFFQIGSRDIEPQVVSVGKMQNYSVSCRKRHLPPSNSTHLPQCSAYWARFRAGSAALTIHREESHLFESVKSLFYQGVRIAGRMSQYKTER